MTTTKKDNVQKSDVSIGIGFVVFVICCIGGFVSAIVLRSLWLIAYGMVSGFLVFLVGALISLVYYCKQPTTDNGLVLS